MRLLLLFRALEFGIAVLGCVARSAADTLQPEQEKAPTVAGF